MSRTKLSFFILCLCVPLWLLATTPTKKETVTFAVKDGQELKMDIYSTDTITALKQPCLMFVFGGGFKEGTRDAAHYLDYFHYFAKKGFKVISIDYRLGMKGQKAPSPFSIKPLKHSIALAVEDLYTATNFVLENSEKLNIDKQQIVISGSSAGAITVLQADYELNNRMPSAEIMPEDFRYAGVISFAGAIFSTHGTPTYKRKPAPTLFFHGSGDPLVPYNRIKIFNLGMFGSKSLAKQFRKNGYPYTFYSLYKIGHEVANSPMKDSLPEIEQFIQDLAFDKKQWMIDIDFTDKLRKPKPTPNPGNYYQ